MCIGMIIIICSLKDVCNPKIGIIHLTTQKCTEKCFSPKQFLIVNGVGKEDVLGWREIVAHFLKESA